MQTRLVARIQEFPENKVFDLDVTLRYALWDWDRGDNRVASHELTYAVNQMELEIALSDQLKSLLFMSLRLNLYEQLLGLHRQIITDIKPHIEAIEAQGAAGVIRMADVGGGPNCCSWMLRSAAPHGK